METNLSNRNSAMEVPEEPQLSRREVSYLQVRRLSGLIWLLAGVLDGMLGIRILLKFIGANPESPFAAWIYRITEPFLVLFQGLTDNPSIGDIVLELHAFFAIAFYALAAWALVRLVWLVFYRPEDIQ